jgi:hypothetical protein
MIGKIGITVTETKRSYTIVFSDREAGIVIPSNATTIIRADGAREARDRFEYDHPSYQVHGVFLGELVELLSTHDSENAYLGNLGPVQFARKANR